MVSLHCWAKSFLQKVCQLICCFFLKIRYFSFDNIRKIILSREKYFLSSEAFQKRWFFLSKKAFFAIGMFFASLAQANKDLTKEFCMTNVKNQEMLLAAHKASFMNERLVKESEVCGCFSCGRIYPATEIGGWCPDGAAATAICPYCAVDAVIPDASGWPVTPDFLAEMRRRWFGR